jgi:hypothetical protein
MKFTKEKARELRIGNWINIIGLVPTQALWQHIQFISEGDNQYSAIPLTEEWLIKFGFESRVETTYSLGYSRDYKVHSLNGFTYNSIQAAWWYHRLLDKQPEYVHQLQNLYFALTSEELTIKENV